MAQRYIIYVTSSLVYGRAGPQHAAGARGWGVARSPRLHHETSEGLSPCFVWKDGIDCCLKCSKTALAHYSSLPVFVEKVLQTLKKKLNIIIFTHLNAAALRQGHQSDRKPKVCRREHAGKRGG